MYVYILTGMNYFGKNRIPALALLVWTVQHEWPSTKMELISAHALQDLLDNTVKQVFQRISLAYSTYLSFPNIIPCPVSFRASYMTYFTVYLILFIHITSSIIYLILLEVIYHLSGFHQSCDQIKNRNYSMNKVKNLGYDRWLKYKQPRQESDLCCFSRYLQKCVTQIYRALYGDSRFVPSEGRKYGDRKATETSANEFCY